MSFKSYIRVDFSVVGEHYWPDAGDRFPHLGIMHPHSFRVVATKHVTHHDREVEFQDMRGQMIGFMNNHWPSDGTDGHLSFGPLSCERIAAILADVFDLDSCWVLEDGECGGGVERARD